MSDLLISIPRLQSTPRTNVSLSIIIGVFFVPDVFACAMRSKGPTPGMSWGASETCTSCGKCVQVCPTGALFEKGKAVADMAKRREFLPYLTLMRGQHR